MAGSTEDSQEPAVGESERYSEDGVHGRSVTEAQEPPELGWEALKFLGPSFAVVAITIGGGELIATTAAGARIGLIALWFVIIGLLVKVGMQYQIAKYGMIEDKTPHQIFDEVPGKIFGHSWTWWWIVFFWVVFENIYFMGIFFGAGVILHYLTLQTVPIAYTLLVVLVITIAPALLGYDFVENLSTILVSSLVVITVVASISTIWTPYGVTVDEIAYGLSFHLPNSGILTLFATVGLTGIAVQELIAYALYVRTTGYGKLAGPSDADGWKERMDGWLRIMKLDVAVSTLLILVITIAFFIIGATVVAGMGEYPTGPQLAVYLASAYSELFGAFGYWVLLIGGFFALYSTAFGQTQLVATAWPDWIQQTEWGANLDEDRLSTILAIVMPIIWYVGGYIAGVITPLIIIAGVFITITYIPEIITAAWTLRNENDFRSTGWARAGIWLSLAGTFLMVIGLIVYTVIS